MTPSLSRRFVNLGLVLLAGHFCQARGEDWPQWGGHEARNMVSTEKGLPDSFTAGKRKRTTGVDLETTQNVKWAARLGSENYSTPAVAGGKVYVGTNDDDIGDPKYQSTEGGVLKCFDEATGKPLWKLVIPRTDRRNNKKWLFDNMALGVCSSPAVDGDRAYVVTNRCEVVCLDTNGMANGNQGLQDEGTYSVGFGAPPVTPGPTDADILWRFDMVSQLPSQPHDAANSAILVLGDLVYVCTSNGVEKGGITVPYPEAPSVIALDKRTGRLVAGDAEKIGTRLFHGQWSSPSAGTVNGRELVFFGAGDGICYAFEHVTAPLPQQRVSLKKVWSYDCLPTEFRLKDGKPIDYWSGDVRERKGNRGDGAYAGPCEIIATPVFYHNRVYVAIGQDPRHGRGRGMLHCIDATQTGDVNPLRQDMVLRQDRPEHVDRRHRRRAPLYCRLPGQDPLSGRRDRPMLLGSRDEGRDLGLHTGGRRQALHRHSEEFRHPCGRQGEEGSRRGAARLADLGQPDRRQRRSVRHFAEVSLGSREKAVERSNRRGRGGTQRAGRLIVRVLPQRPQRSITYGQAIPYVAAQVL